MNSHEALKIDTNENQDVRTQCRKLEANISLTRAAQAAGNDLGTYWEVCQRPYHLLWLVCRAEKWAVARRLIADLVQMADIEWPQYASGMTMHVELLSKWAGLDIEGSDWLHNADETFERIANHRRAQFEQDDVQEVEWRAGRIADAVIAHDSSEKLYVRALDIGSAMEDVIMGSVSDQAACDHIRSVVKFSDLQNALAV